MNLRSRWDSDLQNHAVTAKSEKGWPVQDGGRVDLSWIRNAATSGTYVGLFDDDLDAVATALDDARASASVSSSRPLTHS